MKNSKKCLFYVQIVFIFCWLSFLSDSDSYFMPYLFIGMMGSLCIYSNHKNKILFCKDYETLSAVVLSAIFSTAVLMANYAMLADAKFTGEWGKAVRLIYVAVLISGGGFSMYHILRYLLRRPFNPVCSLMRYKQKTGVVFACSLAIISLINLAFLLLAGYPGILTPDSVWQVSQALSGNYSNHHPFYHTIVIKLFLSAGMQLFKDINVAVALYSVFQIFFMAACFSFIILTLYQMSDKKAAMAALFWYAAMPFHIMYSFTMWKDVMFGGMVALFLTALFRIQKQTGEHTYTNRLLMIAGGTGVCLFRSNGWFAFALSLACFVILFRRKHKRIILMLVGILAVTFVLKHTVLEILGVSQPDTVEALSIPVQQIARVITDDGKLTDSQLNMLEQIVDVSQVKAVYNQGISDPVKGLIRERGNQNYLLENRTEYLKLYICIGLANPGEYIKAWIDETKGYWNSGYSYWRWGDGVCENSFGISQTVRLSSVKKALDNYLWLCSSVVPLQIFMCIGFFVWGVVVSGYVCLVRKNREGLFLCIFNLAIIFSLLISTPVFSEFRYAYAVFCCMPLLLFASFHTAPTLAVPGSVV